LHKTLGTKILIFMHSSDLVMTYMYVSVVVTLSFVDITKQNETRVVYEIT